MDAETHARDHLSFPQLVLFGSESSGIHSEDSTLHARHYYGAYLPTASNATVSNSTTLSQPTAYSDNAYNNAMMNQQERLVQIVATQQYQDDMSLMLGSSSGVGLSHATMSTRSVTAWNDEHLNATGAGNDLFYPVNSLASQNGHLEASQSRLPPTHSYPSLGDINQPNIDGYPEREYNFPNSFPSTASSGYSRSTLETWPLTPELSSTWHPSSQLYSSPDIQASQGVHTFESSLFQGKDAPDFLTAPRYVLPSQNLDLRRPNDGVSPSLDSTLEYPSPNSETISSYVASPAAMDDKQARDTFLILCRQNNMSYKEIKEQGGFDQSISTLRGRYRNLTKDKKDRVRKPKWTTKDVGTIGQCQYRRNAYGHRLTCLRRGFSDVAVG